MPSSKVVVVDGEVLSGDDGRSTAARNLTVANLLSSSTLTTDPGGDALSSKWQDEEGVRDSPMGGGTHIGTDRSRPSALSTSTLSADTGGDALSTPWQGEGVRDSPMEVAESAPRPPPPNVESAPRTPSRQPSSSVDPVSSPATPGEATTPSRRTCPHECKRVFQRPAKLLAHMEVGEHTLSSSCMVSCRLARATTAATGRSRNAPCARCRSTSGISSITSSNVK